MKRLIKDNSGLTLIEVLIATTIMIIVLIPIMNLFTTSILNFQSAGNKTQLLTAGEAIMEKITAGENYTAGQQLNYEAISGIKYDLSISSYNGDNSLQKVDLKVYWQDSPDNFITLTTIRLVK
jgi:Tfp pilus assembly protein PilV